MALRVVRNEVDGWDVIREDEGVSLSNHPDRASAEAAAELRAKEDRLTDEGDAPVEVHPEEVHGIDDSRQGMRRAFLVLGGLLALVAILIVILALAGELTGFGS